MLDLKHLGVFYSLRGGLKVSDYSQVRELIKVDSDFFFEYLHKPVTFNTVENQSN